MNFRRQTATVARRVVVLKNVQIYFIFSFDDILHLSTVQLVLAALSHAQSVWPWNEQWLTALSAQEYILLFLLLVCADVHLHLFRLGKKNTKEAKNVQNTWRRRRGPSLIRRTTMNLHFKFCKRCKRCQRTIHLSNSGKSLLWDLLPCNLMENDVGGSAAATTATTTAAAVRHHSAKILILNWQFYCSSHSIDKATKWSWLHWEWHIEEPITFSLSFVFG